MASRSLAQMLRQHHGIEHATVALLSRHVPGVRVAAHSDLAGFTVFGEVETDVLCTIAEEALARLQRGEAELAIHPNCGTNLVTAGAFAGLGALAMTHGRDRSWWDRAPAAILGATLALILALPAGHWLQANVTTSAEVAGLRIADVTRLAGDGVTRHRVTIDDQDSERPAR